MSFKETLDAKVTDDGNIRKLNQYELKKELGSGSFGVVHLAWDSALSREVAIKEFSKTKLRKQHAQRSGQLFGGVRGRGRGRGRGQAREEVNPLDMIKEEIAILKKLNHPNCIKLYEVLDDPTQDSIFMVIELCQKGTVMSLDTQRDTQPLKPENVRDYFRQLLLGIEYLHANEIAHRDIKPDNMMLSKDNVLKIVDFGVSEIFAKGNDKSDKTVGTPAFYAPEMAGISHGELSAQAADIWAMGVTLYCMSFGKLPFKGSSIMELYNAIQQEEPVIPTGTDPFLEDLLKRLLNKNYETRITLDQIRSHPYVTNNGRSPLIPKEANLQAIVTEVTESELNAAIKTVSSIFTVLKAAGKFKKLANKGS
ncbi:kinase-like domain-containing protein [Gorgonomyces haynaldii]|nr:kinase-like domain-containing protein [Gorgonomyces haynaldii]